VRSCHEERASSRTELPPRDTDVNNRRFQIFIAMFIFRERERDSLFFILPLL